MDNTKKIYLKFRKENGKYYNIVIRNGKEEISSEEIKELMNKIVDKKLIKEGDVLISEAKEASLVETRKKNFEIK